MGVEQTEHPGSASVQSVKIREIRGSK